MKTIHKLFLLLFFFPIVLQAQINLKEAYVVSHEGDTIMGYVDFRTNKINATQCLFKKTLEGENLIYQPGEIESYRFINEGKLYVSKSVKIDEQEREIFLEYLIKGMMSLYYYQDAETNQEYYFFENENKEMMQMTKAKSYVNEDSKRVEDNRYIGVLNYMFFDIPNVLGNLNSIDFNRKDLINVVERYHKEVCTTGEECIEYENRYNDNRLEVKVSVFGGVNIYKHQPGFNEIYSSSTINPTLGVQIDLKNPRWSRVFSLQIEGALTQIRTTREAFYYVKTPMAAAQNKAMMWNTSISPKYTYPKGNFRPTIEAGLNTNLLFAKKRTLKPSGEYINDIEKYIHNYKHDRLQTFFIGFHAAIGVDYKLQNESFILFRMGYDMSFSKTLPRMSSDVLSGFSIKTGYTF